MSLSRRTRVTSPQPPPECSVCREPIRRQQWALTGGVCTGCSSTPQGMAAHDRARRLRAAATPTRQSTDQRIERLAARRAARAAQEGQ